MLGGGTDFLWQHTMLNNITQLLAYKIRTSCRNVEKRIKMTTAKPKRVSDRTGKEGKVEKVEEEDEEEEDMLTEVVCMSVNH